MPLKSQPAMLCMTAILSSWPSGCGGNEVASGNASGRSDIASKSSEEDPADPIASGGANQGSFTLGRGPDVCFRSHRQALEGQPKVSEITSFFSAGSEIDSSATEPRAK